ncbi:hypothetical protein SRIMM317S_04927 [Streptomyces rimosus subsp. rimosus]
MTTHPQEQKPCITPDDLVTLLGDRLHAEVVEHFVALSGGAEPAYVERQVTECLRYLYLVSRHREQLSGLFLPVEQDIDEIWHYLILQTREYRQFCEERLPGRFFIEHRSIGYEDYQQEPGREQAIEASPALDTAVRAGVRPLRRGRAAALDDRALPARPAGHVAAGHRVPPARRRALRALPGQPAPPHHEDTDP